MQLLALLRILTLTVLPSFVLFRKPFTILALAESTHHDPSVIMSGSEDPASTSRNPGVVVAQVVVDLTRPVVAGRNDEINFDKIAHANSFIVEGKPLGLN
ncbi:MAG: hypothetical protein ACW99J_17845 [Candidatus Thorarchaeota archaeon]